MKIGRKINHKFKICDRFSIHVFPLHEKISCKSWNLRPILPLYIFPLHRKIGCKSWRQWNMCENKISRKLASMYLLCLKKINRKIGCKSWNLGLILRSILPLYIFPLHGKIDYKINRKSWNLLSILLWQWNVCEIIIGCKFQYLRSIFSPVKLRWRL